MKRLIAMTRARITEMLRDRSALAWNLLFAPLLVIGMAEVFSGAPQMVAKVGVLSDAPLEISSLPFLATPAVQFYPEFDADEPIQKIRRQRIDMLLDLRTKPLRYWINQESPKARMLQKILSKDEPDAVVQLIEGDSIRFADWLVPGLLSLNVMFSSLFAIGHVIVRYRKAGYLKRLNGTPLRAAEFLSAQLIASLVIIVMVAVGIFAACQALLHLRMEGSYLTLLLVTIIGSTTMIAMSLLISARISSEELSGGLLNLISWPMMLLSGALFSLDGAPPLLQKISSLLPLTQMLRAVRAVMLDGAGLAQVAQPLLVMLGMTALFLLVGAGGFRWSQP